jgi:hypothetical protein
LSRKTKFAAAAAADDDDDRNNNQFKPVLYELNLSMSVSK